MNIDSALLHSIIDHVNVPVTANATNIADSSNTNINYDSNDIQSLRNSEQLNQYFSADYNGPFTTIAEHSDVNLKIDHWHSLKYAKIFSSNFVGIINIKPIGHKKIKITFNTKVSANNFLTPLYSQTLDLQHTFHLRLFTLSELLESIVPLLKKISGRDLITQSVLLSLNASQSKRIMS